VPLAFYKTQRARSATAQEEIDNPRQ